LKEGSPVNIVSSLGIETALAGMLYYEAQTNYSRTITDFVTMMGTNNLPGYLWRDDLKHLQDIYLRFSERYLSLYYKSDNDVINDVDLQNWVNECVSARVRGFPEIVNTFDTLKSIVAQYIWIVTALHHSIDTFVFYNFETAFPYHPLAIYAPMPTEKGTVTMNNIVQWLPPVPALVIAQVAGVASLWTVPIRQTDTVINSWGNIQLGANAAEIVSDVQQELSAMSSYIQARAARESVIQYNILDPFWLPYNLHV